MTTSVTGRAGRPFPTTIWVQVGVAAVALVVLQSCPPAPTSWKAEPTGLPGCRVWSRVPTHMRLEFPRAMAMALTWKLPDRGMTLDQLMLDGDAARASCVRQS